MTRGVSTANRWRYEFQHQPKLEWNDNSRGARLPRPDRLDPMPSPLSKYRREALWGLAVGSQVLVELYRSLGDPKQQDRAVRLGRYGVEQLQRANLFKVVELRARGNALKLGLSDETELEHHGWYHGLLAGFELAFLVVLGTSALDRHGLQGAMGQVQRTLGAAVLGIDTAFPTEAAIHLVRSSLDAAEVIARGAVEAQFHENPDGLSNDEVRFLIAQSIPPIRESLWAAVLTLRPQWV